MDNNNAKTKHSDCSSKQIPDYVGRLKKRIEISKSSIRFWSNEKTLGNIYSILLYELPLIFSEGKVIAGFELQEHEEEEKVYTSTIGDFRLKQQPLNTLHLSERVILRDHFKDLISQLRKEHKEGSHYSEYKYNDEFIINEKRRKIADYLGITKKEKELTFPNTEITYLFKFSDFSDSEDLLWLLYCPINTLTDDDLTNIHEEMTGYLYCAFKLYAKQARTPRMYYVEPIGIKAPLSNTVNALSVDGLLYTRQYLKTAIDNLCNSLSDRMDHEIKQLKISLKTPNNQIDEYNNISKPVSRDEMRVLFLRTTRPDVNYFTPIVTPKMWGSIFTVMKYDSYEKSPGIFETVLSYIKGDFLKEYKEYHDKLEEQNKNNWQRFFKDGGVIEAVYSALSEEDKGFRIDEILNNIDKLKEAISEYLSGKTFDYALLGTGNEEIFKLTLMAVAFIESTPLVAGIAYTVGKKGVPYYCYGWQDKHPYLETTRRDDSEKELRYPTFMEKFLDEKVLRANSYPLTMNYPVVINGTLFGVFILYPDIKDDNEFKEFESKQGNFLYKVLRDIENGWPDLIRAFFLDVCANVTRILSNIKNTRDKNDSNSDKKNKSKLLSEFIKDVERILHRVHNIPRTYIIDARGIGTNQSLLEETIVEKMKKAFIRNDPEIKKLTEKMLESYRESDLLFRSDDNIILPPENPDIEGKIYFNIVAKYTYAGYKLLIIDDWKFFVIQISEKPWECFSQREKDNSSFLCQAIETGFMSLRRQIRFEEAGTKAAITAIMARNISHNIGSHVISYWTTELQEKLKSTESKLGKLYSPEEAMIKTSKELFQYIQHRQDFIAELATSIPSSEMSLDLETDIFGPFKKPNEEKYNSNVGKDSKGGKCISAMLGYIAESENINMHDKIELKTDGLTNTRASIPNGLVGVHAVYSILENFIRNSAKHCKESLVNGQEMIRIEVKESENERWKENYYAVTVWDWRNNSCRKETIESYKKFLPGSEGKESAFTDLNGSLKSGGWGIKEMLTSANFLRKMTPENLYKYINNPNENKSEEPPLLEALCDSHANCTDAKNCARNKYDEQYKGKFGIRFYLRKPKDLAVVSNNEKSDFSFNADGLVENSKFAIKRFTNYRDYAKEISSYNMVLVEKDEENELADDPVAPCRIKPCDGKTAGNGTDNRYLKLYEEFIKKTFNYSNKDKLPIPHYNPWGGALKKGVLCKYFNYSENGNGAFFGHLSDPKNVKKGAERLLQGEYIQPVSGGYSTKAKLENIGNNIKDTDICRQVLLEVAEAVFVEVVIVDERINDWANKEFARFDVEKSDKKILKKLEVNNGRYVLYNKDILNGMKIHVVDIDKENIDYDALKGKLNNWLKPDGGNKKTLKPCFFVIHQGVLDKLKDGHKKDEALMARVNCRWRVIDSGRGVPEKNKLDKYPKARFVQISALQRLFENFDKHGLVQTLFSTRRPAI